VPDSKVLTKRTSPGTPHAGMRAILCAAGAGNAAEALSLPFWGTPSIRGSGPSARSHRSESGRSPARSAYPPIMGVGTSQAVSPALRSCATAEAGDRRAHIRVSGRQQHRKPTHLATRRSSAGRSDISPASGPQCSHTQWGQFRARVQASHGPPTRAWSRAAPGVAAPGASPAQVPMFSVRAVTTEYCILNSSGARKTPGGGRGQGPWGNAGPPLRCAARRRVRTDRREGGPPAAKMVASTSSSVRGDFQPESSSGRRCQPGLFIQPQGLAFLPRMNMGFVREMILPLSYPPCICSPADPYRGGSLGMRPASRAVRGALSPFVLRCPFGNLPRVEIGREPHS
jgi:hypothetical protein